MGKYMKRAKAKAKTEVAVMDVSLGGVRTRAKTLALQRLQKSSSAASAMAESATASSGGSYLQLRSRRLRKPPVHCSRRHQKHGQSRDFRSTNPSPSPNSGSRASSRLRVEGSVGLVSTRDLGKMAEEKVVGSGEEIGYGDNNACNSSGSNNNNNNNNNVDVGIEASLGENVLEFENRDRGTRESTPCSLIRDPEMVRTPGSSTRPTSTRSVLTNPRNIPTADEVNEFFAAAEEEQQRLFIEKYNFDPVNEKPLPGRFEWEKV